MMVMISLSSLLLSAILLQLGSGGLGPLDVLSGLELGYSTEQIGLLGSAHFVGFFFGCWWAPRLIGVIGHSRAFAVFTAAGTIGVLAHMLLINPYAWSGMRILSGMCVAGCFTVIEAWLQAKVNNQNRGRVFSIYRIADMSGSAAAQLIIGILDPAHYTSYILLSILCCASLLPLALTRIPQPQTPGRLRLRPLLAVRTSPMATSAVIAAGATSASFRMIGPIYGREVGLEISQLGFFLAAFVVGGAVAQYPAGWLSDRYDRRHVLVGLAFASVLACVVSIMTVSAGITAMFLAAILFGFMTFPVYSVAVAHANDFVDTSEMVELSSSLLFFYALGAIVSPLFVSILVANTGPNAMFIFIAFIHFALGAYSLVRMRIRPTPAERTPYLYTPRTSFLIGRILKGRRRDLDS